MRGQQKYLDRFSANYSTITDTVKKYLSLGNLLSVERAALLEIQKVADQYNDQLSTIVSMKKSGTSIGKLDGTVKVDDSPALNAFEILNKEYQNLTSQSNQAMSGSIRTSLLSIVSSILNVSST